MESDIQKAIEAGKLTAAAGGALARLAPGTYVQHKSWGFGQIDSFDFLVGQVVIHFKTKRGHTMQIQYAAESLVPIPPEHILALKAADPDGLKRRLKEEPVPIMRTILESHGGKATQEQIAAALVPDLLTEAEFKRWIEATKKALKVDGHFAIPTKKGLPFELRDGPISHADEYTSAFNNARQLKDQIKAVELIIKHVGDFPDPVAQLSPIVNAVNETSRKSSKLQNQVLDALTLLATRDELLEKVPGIPPAFDAPTLAAVLRDEVAQLSTLLSALPASKTKRAVAALPEAFGDDWTAKGLRVLLYATDARTVGETAGLLAEKGKGDETRAALSRAVSEHSLSSAALVWLCGERSGPFSDLLNAKLVGAIVAALERDQHNEKKDRKLHDLLLNDQDLLVDLISDASAEELRDLMRKLMMTTVFEDLNKRSLLGRIVRVYPELGAMITGGGEEKQESLIVSWESLEKRKAEYDELVNKRIPENVKEISIARSYGDLRENFEFKAAKEMQRVLNRRRAEMERDLAVARGTDFANPDTATVGIGTVVTLRELPAGAEESYTILGAWDGDPDKKIVSYQSALAQALIGHKPGDQINLPTEHGERAVQIAGIVAWKA